MGRSAFSLLPVNILFLLSVSSASEFIPPQALLNLAHVDFPQDRIAGQNYRLQLEKHGMSEDVRCSSLIGPYCASSKAITEGAESALFLGRRDHGLSVKTIFLELNDDALIEADGYLKLSEDALQDLRHELGLKELMVEKLTRMDPEWVAKVADTVAEALGIEDKETFKHRVMSDFSAMLTKSSDPQSSSDDEEEEEEEGREGFDAFNLHPTNLKYEVEQQEEASAHYMDRTARVVVEGLSELFLDREHDHGVKDSKEGDEDYDEYLDPDDDEDDQIWDW